MPLDLRWYLLNPSTGKPWLWKQQGRQPIVLTVYDGCTEYAWHPLVEEAVALWGAALPMFELTYFAGPPPAGTPYPFANVVEEFPPYSGPVRTVVSGTPNGQHVEHAGIVVANVDWYMATFTDPDPNSPDNATWQMRRSIRYEMGHVVSFADFPMGHDAHVVYGGPGGSASASCVMGNGIDVLPQFDEPILAQVYRT
jgi:hypothetical protein